jgi:hypothetical protein
METVEGDGVTLPAERVTQAGRPQNKRIRSRGGAMGDGEQQASEVQLWYLRQQEAQPCQVRRLWTWTVGWLEDSYNWAEVHF